VQSILEKNVTYSPVNEKTFGEKVRQKAKIMTADVNHFSGNAIYGLLSNISLH
jgi:hypothetical protein